MSHFQISIDLSQKHNTSWANFYPNSIFVQYKKIVKKNSEFTSTNSVLNQKVLIKSIYKVFFILDQLTNDVDKILDKIP